MYVSFWREMSHKQIKLLFTCLKNSVSILLSLSPQSHQKNSHGPRAFTGLDITHTKIQKINRLTMCSKTNRVHKHLTEFCEKI